MTNWPARQHRAPARRPAAVPAPQTPRKYREEDLFEAVRELCKILRLLVYHTRDSRGSYPGFPDLVIIGPGGMLYRELKSATGRLTKDQKIWLGALHYHGVDVGVWRPADMANGRISRELQALRRARTVKVPSTIVVPLALPAGTTVLDDDAVAAAWPTFDLHTE